MFSILIEKVASYDLSCSSLSKFSPLINVIVTLIDVIQLKQDLVCAVDVQSLYKQASLVFD